MAEHQWYFSKEQLANTPSRRAGLDADKELSYRQQAANFIQDMGQKLAVNQLAINTAIVYMHRFYMFHSFAKFHRNPISACAIYLAAKVEEQPRKLEHVIKVSHMFLRPSAPLLDIKSKEYATLAHELVVNENIMLQTLGFTIAVEHPHSSVVRCCQLVKASKDLAQTSYFLATNSLHLTTMCLRYKPTLVACVCINLACKWSGWEIPRSAEDKDWFFYVESSATPELLKQLTTEFLSVMEKCPSRLKRKVALSGGGGGSASTSHSPNPHDSSTEAAEARAAALKQKFDLEVNNYNNHAHHAAHPQHPPQHHHLNNHTSSSSTTAAQHPLTTSSSSRPNASSSASRTIPPPPAHHIKLESTSSSSAAVIKRESPINLSQGTSSASALASIKLEGAASIKLEQQEARLKTED